MENSVNSNNSKTPKTPNNSRTYTLWEPGHRYHAQRLEEMRLAGYSVGQNDIIKDGVKVGYHYHDVHDYYNAWGIVLFETCKKIFDFERE